MSTESFVYLNGKIIPKSQASIGIDDLALNRGYGVFDFLRTRNYVPLYLDAHLHRFNHSARQMHLHIDVDEPTLQQVILSVIKKNEMPECGIKILATGGYSESGFSIGKPNLIISCHPLPSYSNAVYENGIAVITHNYHREMPVVKSINYSMGVWLIPKIQEAGADDVLYCSDGLVHESPRSNVFVVNKEGEVCTPIHGILHGITRRNVLQLSRKFFPTHEMDVTIDMLCDGAEAFITSTTKGIMPVTSIDGSKVGNGKPGPVTQQLSKALALFEEKYLAEVNS